MTQGDYWWNQRVDDACYADLQKWATALRQRAIDLNQPIVTPGYQASAGDHGGKSDG